MRRSYSLSCFILLFASTAMAADVTNPGEVNNLLVAKVGSDIQVQWDAVTLDASGNLEDVNHYDVYRGVAAGFVPDKAGEGNRIGSPTAANFIDLGAANDVEPLYFYLVSAVDQAGNEGVTQPSQLMTPPVLSGFWTDTTIELDWTSAQPMGEVVAYKVYRGPAADQWDFVEDVSLAQVYTAILLATNVNWYFAVTAVDTGDNETVFSNPHVDPVGGTIDIRVHDETELCWGASDCTPTDPDHVQRSNGFQLLIPANFPEGDWGLVEVTFTMDSRLCTPPAGGNVTKCGSGNPCVSPPCNGGYNTCGDPWDRTAHLFLVLDDCIDQGQACMNHDNIELMRAITPFGTDARPPDGAGVVPRRALTLDITPFAPLLVGQRRYIGAHIGHFVQTGWWVTSDFHFSKRPEDVSLKPAADGFDPVFFHSSGSGLTGPFTVDIPATAQQVVGRLFITGHGGNSDPTCNNPADEFCQRTNKIIVDSTEAWRDVPWRDCCYPRGTEPGCTGCQDWNACGYPSCTFDRSGWCPGEMACHYNLDEGCDQDLLFTSNLLPGQSHDIEYEILDINGSWSRSLVVYWYDDYTQFCGNNIQEGTELCDGIDLGGETCQTQGFDAGTLVCAFGCQGFDTSGCRRFECPNSICEPSAGEDCISCPDDCNGIQSGNPSLQYCCGDGDGDAPVDCSDTRCTAGGNTCEP
ncbi:MAG: hypothetical protein IH848_01195 [Acidobacteria bacterium]|nr:hypothetical protein [Acidobacteriota bacterium]